MSDQEVLANQKIIIDNQTKLLANQKAIQDNQAAILKNQTTLEQLEKNQAKILSLLQK